jgi:uncharacterized membrane protein YeaQ/YmgE (transglycosylase-associated protein family)
MFSLIGAIIVGFIAGALAKTTLLGIGGAIIATWLGQFVGFYRYGETAGLIGAIVGAVAILAAYRAFKK